jgi:lipoprotein-anchoring transpeptidase ErfK/SrfK
MRILPFLLSALLAACNVVPHAELTGGMTYAAYQEDGQQETRIAYASRPAELRPEMVVYEDGELPGTIVIRTKERRLYLVLSDNKAIRYPVGVGKAGRQWQGRAVIDGAHIQPAWAPTPEIKRDNPDLPDVIPGGYPGNPMGTRALTLSGGEYAIHGTNRPESIGTYASYGCIRMFNEDIIDLFRRVRVGTEVVVTL